VVGASYIHTYNIDAGSPLLTTEKEKEKEKEREKRCLPVLKDAFLC
jgi:hypothetical protein